MKRVTGLFLTLALVNGCSTIGTPQGTMNGGTGGGLLSGGLLGRKNSVPMHYGATQPAKLGNVCGPWGQPVEPFGWNTARDGDFATPRHDPRVMQAGYNEDPNLMAGPAMPPYAGPPQGVVNAAGMLPEGGPGPFQVRRSQVRFVGPAGAKIGWYVPGPTTAEGSKPMMISNQLDVPGRYNFLQASIYRLKLSNIVGRPGVELYPTLEVVPSNPKTDAFLAHNFIPVEFTEEDFDQVTAGNFLTKVIYLPDSQYQSPVAAGLEELVSTRLEPGVDPIAEAHRRGHILLVVRLGGINLETASSPAIDNIGRYGTTPPPCLNNPYLNPSMAVPMAPPPASPWGMDPLGGPGIQLAPAIPGAPGTSHLTVPPPTAGVAKQAAAKTKASSKPQQQTLFGNIWGSDAKESSTGTAKSTKPAPKPQEQQTLFGFLGGSKPEAKPTTTTPEPSATATASTESQISTVSHQPEAPKTETPKPPPKPKERKYLLDYIFGGD